MSSSPETTKKKKPVLPSTVVGERRPPPVFRPCVCLVDAARVLPTPSFRPPSPRATSLGRVVALTNFIREDATLKQIDEWLHRIVCSMTVKESATWHVIRLHACFLERTSHRSWKMFKRYLVSLRTTPIQNYASYDRKTGFALRDVVQCGGEKTLTLGMHRFEEYALLLTYVWVSIGHERRKWFLGY